LVYSISHYERLIFTIWVYLKKNTRFTHHYAATPKKKLSKAKLACVMHMISVKPKPRSHTWNKIVAP